MCSARNSRSEVSLWPVSPGGARHATDACRALPGKRLRPSELPGEIRAQVERLDRMEVIVVDTRRGLAGQPRGVPICDVVVLRVEQVQNVEPEIEVSALVAGLEVHDG